MNELISFIKERASLFFLFVGLAILVGLLYYVDFDIIRASFNMIGSKIVIVFAIPIIWISCNTLCISTLTQHQIPFHHLLYNQITGDAYNVLTPFAGLGGEPYKIKHLTNWLSLDKASEAILRDRLIHTLSGIFYSCLTLWIVLFIVELPQSFFFTFIVIGTVLALLTALLGFVILSDKPEKFLGIILKKLKLLEEFRGNALNHSIFFQALLLKTLGRFLNLVEIYTIFYLLGVSVGFSDVMTVSAMLSLTSTLLFIIPQGIGINEAGISGALKLIGHSVELGLSIGLIRRARVLFWAVFGLSLHFFSLLVKNIQFDKQIEHKKQH